MTSIAIERDLVVPVRDGVRLFANLSRTGVEERYPVIMSVTSYGKDKLPDRVATFFMRLSGVKFGKLNCSRLTGFEAPDPAYWVQQGYAVLQADVRGMHKSEGHAGVVRQQDAEDYYDLIEWAASQPWCTGELASWVFPIWRCRNGTSRP
jgi:putative CocE/NonD family hydrolase